MSFSDITIQQLADLAGISRPMFYYYFDDKHDLLAHTFAAAVPLELRAKQQLGGWASGAVQLRTALVAVAHLIDRDRELFAAALQVSGHHEAISAVFRSTCESIRAILADRLRSIQLGDGDRGADPDLTAIGLTMFVRGMVRQLILDDGDPDTVAELVDVTTLVMGRVLIGTRAAE